ncbi:4Fe-4S binding protein [Fusibacter bizertensis]|uniref:4Fe-4S binding protein n=1 Tax=Fusibacter bizertensis TaxID=1488331 RepID=A0ABT6NBU2_9FIRM|nr:4Fe-4S binding protein [Fusibacter bizertensis]MDH8677887.1 4Fe-4S binding protein [Fusibacter bizertensis]
MKRNVIEINEEKCIGCGLCAGACMQGAIEIIDGKAKLVSESYCDGLGMCLPKCPVDAIHVVEKDTEVFDQSRKNIKAKSKLETTATSDEPMACGCSGTHAKSFDRSSMITLDMAQTSKAHEEKVVPSSTKSSIDTLEQGSIPSQLMQWPVQLRLISPNAPYLNGADLLIAADCTAFAYGDFHRDFIKGKVTVIGCPKLDDNQYNADKIAQILSANDIKSITVVRMEVPCCGGMISAVKSAMLKAECIVPYSEVTISSDGRIIG